MLKSTARSLRVLYYLAVVAGTVSCSGNGTMSTGSDSTDIAKAVTSPAPLAVRVSWPAVTLPIFTPFWSDSFVEAIGFDTHFSYDETPYVKLFPKVSQMLIAMGARHVRDGGTGEGDRLTYLASHGIGHSMGGVINDTAQTILARLAADPTVQHIEPQNEYDAYAKSDPNWVAHLQAEQKLLYQTVRSQAQYNNVAVLGPSFINEEDAATVGDLSAYMDAGNEHDGTCDYNPGTTQAGQSIDPKLQQAKEDSGSKPVWVTETGFNDNWPEMTAHCYVADPQIAKYDPRVVAERFNRGQPRVYFYQFSDVPSDTKFGHTGFLRADGSAKPQYTALQSMIALLADPGAAPHLVPIALSYASPPPDLHHTLLQKRDGSYMLLLWQETASWDPKAQTPITVPTVNVTITVSPTIRSAIDYSYTPAWTLKAVSLPFTGLPVSGLSFTVPVTDSISFVHLSL